MSTVLEEGQSLGRWSEQSVCILYSCSLRRSFRPLFRDWSREEGFGPMDLVTTISSDDLKAHLGSRAGLV